MLHLRLERIHRALAGERLLQAARRLRLGRLPLGQQPLELAELPLDRLERVGPRLELARQACRARRACASAFCSMAPIAARELLQPLRGLRRFLAQRRGPGQVLGRLVERALPLLELLAQQPDPLLQLVELRGAALQRRGPTRPPRPSRRSAAPTEAATAAMVSETRCASSACAASWAEPALGAVHPAAERLPPGP